jgi:hypothetical protein
MLLNWFSNIPRAAHSSGKCHEISLAKRCWRRTVGRSNSDLTRQEIARFIRIICPWEFGDAASPRSPRKDAVDI